VAAGGHIANVGVHGKTCPVEPGQALGAEYNPHHRLVDTVTTPMLFKTGWPGKLQPNLLITHHFTLDQVMQAYDTFGEAMKERALKIIITNEA